MLLNIWPNLSQVLLSSNDTGTIQYRGTASLNGNLAVIRKTRNLRACIAEKYGLEEAHLMIPNDFFSSVFPKRR
jgi:hypothetical protein